jgi:ATP-dependent exoDNAse (exonuclease V) alpha subunit
VDRERLVVTAIDRASREAATWLPTDLARHLATLVPAEGRSARELTAEIDALTAECVARCRDLHPVEQSARRSDGRPIAEAVTDRRLTTIGVWEQEAELLAWAHHRGGAVPASGTPGEIAAAVAGAEGLVVVVGPAGAGKTTLLATAIERLRRDGRPVLGLAPSGKAADVLQRESGCPSITLAKLLTLAERGQALPGAGLTVIVDEAGMAGTGDLARLAVLADQHRWRVVAVGDPAQLPAVGRAGMFAAWCETLPAHHLDQVRRFRQPWEAEASLQLRGGDPDCAAAYAHHGRLRTVHPALLAAKVADHHDRLDARGQTVAITTTSQATATAINVEIQRRRRRRGPAAQLADGTRAHVGDRIATRRNAPTLTTTSGTSVRNRQTWTVDTVHPDGSLTVSDATHGTVRLPPAYVASAVELGWAVTGYGNQGRTVDAGIAILEPGTTRANTYVAMTRGQERNHAWITDPTGTLDPADAFAAAITTPERVLSAHAVARQLHGHDLHKPAPHRAREAPGLSR